MVANSISMGDGEWRAFGSSPEPGRQGSHPATGGMGCRPKSWSMTRRGIERRW
jgi:hypothetical protein